VQASAQEATTAWESAMALVSYAEDQTTLARRETRERVSSVEAKRATTLASTHGEAEGIAQRIALLVFR
jgi:hypothetical protein